MNGGFTLELYYATQGTSKLTLKLCPNPSYKNTFLPTCCARVNKITLEHWLAEELNQNYSPGIPP